jgi:recombinational DNA repair protein (RecF pathway)
VRVIAKGARRITRKGFEGGFDLLVRGEILLYPRRDDGLWIFKEWEEHFRPQGPGASLRMLQLSSYLCELTEAFTVEGAGSLQCEGGQEPAKEEAVYDADGEYAGLYDALARAADSLKTHASPGPLVLSYTLRVLQWSGHLPDLSRCSTCGSAFAGRRARKAAVLSRIGLECEACVRRECIEASAQQRDGGNATAQTDVRIQLSPETLGALDFLIRTGKPVRFSKRAARTAARAMIALVHGALERDLRTLRTAATEVMGMGGA